MRAISGKFESLKFEIPITFVSSFVLPASAHPYEYSGIMFGVFVLKNDHEHEVLKISK